MDWSRRSHALLNGPGRGHQISFWLLVPKGDIGKGREERRGDEREKRSKLDSQSPSTSDAAEHQIEIMKMASNRKALWDVNTGVYVHCVSKLLHWHLCGKNIIGSVKSPHMIPEDQLVRTKCPQKPFFL